MPGGCVGTAVRRRHARSVRRRQQHHGGPRAVLGRAWTCTASCRTCGTPATATTPRSTPSIRAAWRSAASTSPPTSRCSTSQSYLNASIDTLRELAENTDGRAIVNRNDLAAGMKQIIRDSSAYYLVGYNSTQAPTDGKFHEIKVRVKRPGVQVRASQGLLGLHRGRRQARGRGTEAGTARRKSPRRWPRWRR